MKRLIIILTLAICCNCKSSTKRNIAVVKADSITNIENINKDTIVSQIDTITNRKITTMDGYVITKNKEVFDIALYNKWSKASSFSEYWIDGKYMNMLKSTSQLWHTEMRADSYFQLLKIYHLNGNIKSKGLGLATGNVRIGTWYIFDENGVFIREENYDKFFTFTFDDILAFCKNEGIPYEKGPRIPHTGYYTEIYREIASSGDCWWEIEWLKAADIIEVIKIDGKTGRIISVNSYEYVNN